MSTQPFNLSEPGDLNGDGRIDSTFTQAFDADGDGTAETVAGDVNLDGRIDSTYSDLDGDGYQETSLLDTNLDGTLDTVWIDLDGDLLPDIAQPLPVGPFAVADPGLSTCAPQAVFDPGTMTVDTGVPFVDPFAPGFEEYAVTDGIAYDTAVDGTSFSDAYLSPLESETPSFTDAYVSPFDTVSSDMQPAFDSTALTDASWDAWNVSGDYESLSWDAWSVGDYDTSASAEAMSTDWADYSYAMDSLANDPTNSSSWDYAYDAAAQAEWDAWNASVDAYVAGDTEAAYNWNQASIDAASVADSTWDSWSTATSSSYDSSYSSYSSDYSSDY